MLDPRIYRTGLVVVVIAAFVLAFSLNDQQAPLGTTLAPDAFSGQNALIKTTSLAREYPVRRPGSASDDALATYVAEQLRNDGFAVSTNTFTGRTVDGNRTLETVTGTRAGISSGSIVLVAHRDALGAPATADLSGTAVLLELARVLSGETEHHTIVLASTSGSAGAAGAAELAKQLVRPVDAVVVLGNLAGATPHEPIVVPWSDGEQLAPPMLRNTVAAAVMNQAQLRSGGTSIGGQLAHLAFPLSVSEQAPFGVHGEPAVLLSMSGERGPSPEDAVDPSTLTALGRSVLQTIDALDAGPSVPAPSAYMLFGGKVIPAWAIRLFVLALLMPVMISVVDGLARARRRGHHVLPWVAWVLAAGLPFAFAVLAVLAARWVGWIDVAPPGPVGSGVVPLHATDVVLLLTIAGLTVGSWFVVRPIVLGLRGRSRTAHRAGESPSQGAGAALLLVMCGVALAIWLANPFAAALMVPALHLWLWVADPEVRLHPASAFLLLLVGLAPPLLVIVYYALNLGLGPVGLLWSGVLLLAGGQLGVVAALKWCIALGCVASAIVIALRGARARAPEEIPITVRGPVSYAGPGSLGGTESALRRVR